MLNKDTTLAEIVKTAPAAAAVLAYHQLEADGRTLAQAAQAIGLCGCELAQAVGLAVAGRPGPWQMTPAELIEEILTTHHAFLRQALPAGTDLLNQASRQATQANRLAEMAGVFAALRAELESHMMKEEQILFPMILELAGTGRITVGCGHLDGPIQQMEHEHDSAKQALRQLKAQRSAGLPGKAGLPADLAEQIADLLQRLHDDLVLHIYKENQVLFPRAQAMLTPVGA